MRRSKTFEEVIEKLGSFDLPSFDVIVAIGRGGIIPAGLVAQKLDLPVVVLNLRFRDDSHAPVYASPQLLGSVPLIDGKKVLLVDDVSKTGKTFEVAREHLRSAEQISTFVINGKADYALFDEDCFWFPWRV